MKLEHFIASKPKELRLGQYFVNEYWTGSDYTSQTLYQLDGKKAEEYICGLMYTLQWDELPEPKRGYNV